MEKSINYIIKTILVSLIRFYQLCISPMLGKNCRYYPTCSQYALEAIEKKGKIFNADECRKELEEYKKTSRLYARRNVKPGKFRYFCQIIRRKCIYGVFYLKKIVRSLERRTGIIKRI